jgi:hypothetical protein
MRDLRYEKVDHMGDSLPRYFHAEPGGYPCADLMYYVIDTNLSPLSSTAKPEASVIVALSMGDAWSR